MAFSSRITSAGGSILEAMGNAHSKLDSIVDTTKSIKGKIEDAGVAAYDATLDAKDSIVVAVEGTVSFAVAATSFMTSAGLIVAGIVAPVPTFIGIVMLEVLTLGFHATTDGISSEIEARKAQRRKDRIIQTLSKFGTIPTTAVITTETVDLTLDMEHNTISGTVKTGMFSKRDINDMAESEIAAYATSSDDETKELLSAYLKFRNARASQG